MEIRHNREERRMKREARIQAEKMFLRTGGKITNREIANAVKVNPLTIGRWKRSGNWDSKLRAVKADEKAAAAAAVVRKKAARDKAYALYMDAEGNVSNKDLALKVGVSPATISKWKEQDGWFHMIDSEEVELPEEAEDLPAGEKEVLDVSFGQLASPEHILLLNQKIEAQLQREHLSAAEIADLAEAKNDLIEAVKVYLEISRELGEI